MSDTEQNDFDYSLRLQQLVELVRTGQPDKLIEAIIHARKHLADNYPLSQNAAGLIAYAYELNSPSLSQPFKVSICFLLHTFHANAM
jgi:macrophage erythroblast attacher